MKNTVALAWDDRAIVSPHIGDLDAPRSLEIFEHVIADLQSLYRVRPKAIVCDAHPGYASTRYARRSGVPVISVAHHRAHASALAGEHPDVARWLVFTWDGVGYGEDGTLWGGEALLGRPGAWRRVASMRPFRLPGGEKASREPWRSALGLCLEIGREWGECPQSSELLRHAWERRLNAPQTSAVGRLFDAAAALTGLHHRSSFEGQGPMVLEAAATGAAPPIALPLVRSAEGLHVTDWAPLVPAMLDATRTIGERSAVFHATLANALRDQACAVRDACGDFVVGMIGGVFQNRRLTELAIEYLEEDGFDVRLALQLPCNDGGLSFGQLIEAGNEKG
jgi:hydrogenase maturation protein HypF